MQWRVESSQDGWRVLPSDFSGCTKIFLDVGANRATHIRKLFEPEKYNESRYLPIFDEAFGSASFRSMPSRATGLCAFGFEPNPRPASFFSCLKFGSANAPRLCFYAASRSVDFPSC